jgi:hypothetical protein
MPSRLSLLPALLPALLPVLLPATLTAQTTSSTSTARVDGTVACRQIAVSVNQQVQNGGTTTTLAYAVRECSSGSSTPDRIVVQGYGPIPNGDYRVQTSTHTLTTTTVHGSISLVWRATSERQSSFSGTWTERDGGSLTRTQETQAHSTATVEGSAVGYGLVRGERPGWISQLNQTVR